MAICWCTGSLVASHLGAFISCAHKYSFIMSYSVYMRGGKVFYAFEHILWLNFHLTVFLVDRFSNQGVFVAPATNKVGISGWVFLYISFIMSYSVYMRGSKVFYAFEHMLWLNFHLTVLLVGRFSHQGVFAAPATNKVGISGWLGLFVYIVYYVL